MRGVGLRWQIEALEAVDRRHIRRLRIGGSHSALLYEKPRAAMPLSSVTTTSIQSLTLLHRDEHIHPDLSCSSLSVDQCGETAEANRAACERQGESNLKAVCARCFRLCAGMWMLERCCSRAAQCCTHSLFHLSATSRPSSGAGRPLRAMQPVKQRQNGSHPSSWSACSFRKWPFIL